MQKKRSSNKTLTGWLAGSLSAAVLLSGGFASASAALAASSVLDEPATVSSASYGAPAPLPAPAPAPPQPGPLTPPPIPGLPPMGAELDSSALLTALNMNEDQLRQALESGQSLYDAAVAQGADVQKIAGIVADALKARLERELSDGRITSGQYEARLNETASRAEAELKRTHPKPPVPGEQPPTPPTGWGPALGPGLELIDADKLLSTLGMTQEALESSLHDGQSLADIADARGVDRSKLTELAAQAMNARLDQEWGEKRIWTDEYEARKQEIAERAQDATLHKHPHPPLPLN